MKVQVQKWGNSLALRIPKSFAQETKLDQGSIVDLTLKEGEIIVRPVAEEEYSLEELLSRVTKENLHPEISTGEPRGKEVW